VKASESGTLVYGGASPAAEPALAASARTPNASRKAQPEGLQLTVRDQSGRKASLRLVEGLNEDERRQAELPPAPPSGLFDVRFGAGTNAAELGDADGPGATARHTLKMQGTKGAVTIKRSALGGAAPAERAAASRKGGRADDGPRRVVKVVDAATGGSAFEARLTETSPSARVPARVNRLEVRVEGLPASVQLKGAAPNPARQRATIEYAVPEEQKVRIRVYDEAGRRAPRRRRRRSPGQRGVLLPPEGRRNGQDQALHGREVARACCRHPAPTARGPEGPPPPLRPRVPDGRRARPDRRAGGAPRNALLLDPHPHQPCLARRLATLE
jgi:hypothetical protein